MLAMPGSGTYTNGKMGRLLNKRKMLKICFFKTGEDRREDLNLSTVSAQTVLSSRLFQSTTVHGEKKAVSDNGCFGGFYSIAADVLSCCLVYDISCPEGSDPFGLICLYPIFGWMQWIR